MEIEVCTTPQPVAVVTLCEGECATTQASGVVISGRKISFSVVEELRDQSGRRESRTINFVGRLKGHVLVVHNAAFEEQDMAHPEFARYSERFDNLKRVAYPTLAQKDRLECNATAGLSSRQ
jgi:hypothetical protein